MVERTQIQTRIPIEWVEEAEELNVSRAAYVRMMARAGRLNWGFEHTEEPDTPHVKLQEDTASVDEQIDEILQDIVIRNLSTTDGTTKEELVEIVFRDMAQMVGGALKELHDEQLATYDPIDETWVKTK